MTYNEQLNECLAAIKYGDETKFEDLVHLTYGPLLTVAQSYLLDKSNAPAVMSDVYYRIHLYSDRYDTSKDALSYLWQIVKHVAFDYNKQQLKNNTVNIDDIQISAKPDSFERANARIDIAKALKRVGNVNTLIVVWTFRDGLTQEEIAQRLGISKSAVCQRLSKTKRILSEILK